MVEMVVTMTIISIVAATAGIFIVHPIRAYIAVTQRADLIHVAEITMRRIERDIKRAIPNSVRVNSTGKSLELLNTVGGFRYRAAAPNAFNIAPNLTAFNILGKFPNDMLGSNGYRVVVYSLGSYGTSPDDPTPGANVYGVAAAGVHIITPIGTAVTLTSGTTEDNVLFSGSAVQFSYESPQKRVYFADTPVTYLCNESSGTITRLWDYDIQAIQPNDANSIPLSVAKSAVLADKIQSCEFSYDPGSEQRNATVTIKLNVSDGNEVISLLHQVEVDNAP